MGNTTSCSCLSNRANDGFSKKRGNGSKSKTAMLLDTAGNIREIQLPVTSGELMIEEIGHVITPADELRRTRRISALRADEELVAGKVYLLVAANRVHSKASAFEMEIAKEELESVDHQRQRKKPTSGNVVRVSTKLSDLCETDGEKEIGNLPSKVIVPCPTRLGNQRRWNPVLDPIFESS